MKSLDELQPQASVMKRYASKSAAEMQAPPAKAADDEKKEEAPSSPAKDKDGAESSGGRSVTLGQKLKNAPTRFRTEADFRERVCMTS